MSDFADIRARALQIISRMVEQLEHKDGDFTNFDSQILDKVVKSTILLETQASKTGKETGLKDVSIEDLSSDFDD